MSIDFTTPVGRLVRGSLYDAQTTDAEGRPLVTKTGVNTGQPRVSYFFALAIPKGAERHWAETEWGAKIWAEGHAGFPNASKSPIFAWKILDGDDANPLNNKGQERKVLPCNREGHPGNWILSFASGIAPNIQTLLTTSGRPEPLTENKAINPGDYIQVYAAVAFNGSASQPGVFLNHRIVCLRGYGQRIVLGVNAADVGFEKYSVPSGASTIPVSAPMAAPAPATYTPPVTYPPAATPAAMPMPPMAAPAPVAVAAPAPVAVAPHTTILTPPVAMPTPVPVAEPVLKIHPTYNPTGNVSYDAMIKAGWSDDLLKQHGLL